MAAFETELRQAAFRLDAARSALLARSLKLSLLRRAFGDRALRHGLVFASASALLLVVAGLWPLWLLAIGPVVYGVPHLVATARYVPRALADARDERRALAIVVATAMGLVAAFRLVADSALPVSEWKLGGNGPELVATAIVAAFVLWRTRAHKCPAVAAAALLSPLVGFSLGAPLATLGALVLAHNFVAFAYWLAACGSARDRRTAWAALGLFTLAHTAIFTGALDGLTLLGSRAGAVPFARLDFEGVGRTILPAASDPRLLVRAVVAYAFGQAIHYLIWLRLIPEQALHRPAPVGFRKSLTLLREDFGARGLALAAAAVATGLALPLVLSFPAARHAYLALAAFHGYAELVGLAALLARKLPLYPGGTSPYRPGA